MQLQNGHIKHLGVRTIYFVVDGTSNNITNLRILEYLHIYKNKSVLNSTVSAFPLLNNALHYFIIYIILHTYLFYLSSFV